MRVVTMSLVALWLFCAPAVLGQQREVRAAAAPLLSCQQGPTAPLQGPQTPYTCTVKAGTLGPNSGVRVGCVIYNNSTSELQGVITFGGASDAWLIFPQSSLAATEASWAIWNNATLLHQWSTEGIAVAASSAQATNYLVINNTLFVNTGQDVPISCGASRAGAWYGEGFTVEVMP